MRDRLTYNNEMHKTGRIFTWLAIATLILIPIIFCLATGAKPSWSAVGGSFMFILGYWAIGIVEAVSYAPLLGSGAQYQTFITGNIANLKLPCALNTQTILKTKQGSEEEEIVTTISVAVSTIVTTLIIVIGLIPLTIFSEGILDVLAPVSPYVIPAIFGGLGVVLLSRYMKLTVIPFVICLVITITTFALGLDIGQSTMIPIGMAVAISAAFIIYKMDKKKDNIKKNKKR